MLPGSCIAGMGRIEKFSGFQIHRSMQTVVIDHSAVSSHLKHCIDHMRPPLASIIVIMRMVLTEYGYIFATSG